MAILFLVNAWQIISRFALSETLISAYFLSLVVVIILVFVDDWFSWDGSCCELIEDWSIVGVNCIFDWYVVGQL